MSVGAEFERNALAAHASQRLAGPAQALLGLYDLLIEQAGSSDLRELRADLDRIGLAVRQLNGLIGELMQARSPSPATSDEPDPMRIRHDLRTPLNAIVGYAELLLEDAADTGGVALEGDLRAMLAAASELLTRVDVIADLSAAPQHDPTGGERASGLDAARLQLSLAADEVHARLEGSILVVDDVAGNRELLTRRLVREGHAVTKAESGAHALQLAGERDFDLILLDVLMPDMNGIEVLHRLKADKSRRHIPVIMISGLADIDAVARCIESGADDYLSKPFNPVLLKARINAILERKQWRERERRYLARIEAERQRADALLHAVLPGQIVARLKNGEQVIADRFAEATVLFADIVGFSPIAARLSATDLIRRLGAMFDTFDALAEKYAVEKIKTIGDAYMAASGVPESTPDHADRIVALGAAMLDALAGQDAQDGFHIRVGVHTGPVVAGLIGHHRFVYDVWGETVNIASRLESQGVAGCIQLSEATRRALTAVWTLEACAPIDLKGIGPMATYLLRR